MIKTIFSTYLDVRMNLIKLTTSQSPMYCSSMFLLTRNTSTTITIGPY